MHHSCVILGSKPGVYRTLPGDGLTPLEAWEYRSAGRVRGLFVIAALDAETRVTVVEDEAPHASNRIRTKFLPRFASVQAARDELAALERGGGKLVRVPLPQPPSC